MNYSVKNRMMIKCEADRTVERKAKLLKIFSMLLMTCLPLLSPSSNL